MRVENRKALLVGIDTYASGINNLHACVADVQRMGELLEHHERGDPNFSCKLLTSSNSTVTKERFEQAVDLLFQGNPDMVLYYFSGHGSTHENKGYMICQDTQKEDISTGFPMDQLLLKANESQVPEIVIILDCCHAGALGNFSLEGSPITQLREGITVLAATLSSEYAVERMGHGVFTKLLCQGLEGVSADILGHVTAASLYNLADSMLSPWEQRPVYKSFVNKMKPLRYCLPKIPKKALRRINQHFPQPDASIQLSESFLEHTRQATPSDVGLFKELLDYESVGLVQGRMAKTLTSEAEIQGTCILTEYGKLFWQTVAKGLV